MTYTSPHTYVTGETYHSSTLNSEIVNDLRWLYEVPGFSLNHPGGTLPSAQINTGRPAASNTHSHVELCQQLGAYWSNPQDAYGGITPGMEGNGVLLNVGTSPNFYGLTIGRPGIWNFGGQIQVAASNLENFIAFSIYNQVQGIHVGRFFGSGWTSNSLFAMAQGEGLMRCNAGDTITMRVSAWMATPANLTVYGGGPANTRIWGYWVRD